MKREIFGGTLMAIAVAMASVPAHAQTARAASPIDSGGFYISGDGSYQSVKLPSVVDFGFRGLVPGTTTLSPSEKHDSRLDGYGARGSIGYAFAPGVFAPAWGSNVRIEVGGNYTHADGTSFAESAGVTNVNLTVLPLTGIAPGTAGCGGATCSTKSSMTSRYAAWDLHLTSKSDFKFDVFKVTPSITVLVGHGSVNQQFTQNLYSNGALYDPANAQLWGFGMNNALSWNDRGAKAGLDTVYDFSNGLSAGLGGSVGLVRRSTSMVTDATAMFGSIFPRVSAVQDHQTKTAVLANLEASLMARLMSNLVVKGFAGLNYDSSMPGIVAPESIAFSVSGTPAHLKFDATTSYYAGAGLTLNFGP